jgi:adenosylmethionine-8-amino-7-oxononanoate aminotransferase
VKHEDTQTLIEDDRRYVWHPFTQMRQWGREIPLVIASAEGNYLIDSDGNRYLDGVSSLWVNVHGHGRREIVEAISQQAATLAHSTLLGLSNVPAVELAKRLVAITPSRLQKVFYSDNGSTAVEVALKLAFQFWLHQGHPEKRRFVHLKESYHGDTLGAVGVGGIELFHQIYGPLLQPGIAVPNPCIGKEPALAALRKTLSHRSHEIAAVILEPLVQGAAGILVHPPGYLRSAAELCREFDVLLILDEVATGFGRTGSMFACEQENVEPDLLCLAKGITGGTLPLAATLASNRIFEAFLDEPSAGRAFFHGHTYTGNPIACAAALASLDLFEKDNTFQHLPPKIAHLSALLRTAFSAHASVVDIRQRGLMVGIELGAAQVGHLVAMAARPHGVIIRPLGDTLVLMPPLSITHDEISLLVNATRAAIEEVLS